MSGPRFSYREDGRTGGENAFFDSEDRIKKYFLRGSGGNELAVAGGSGSGRDGPFGPPPGQIPASGFPAPGSHLGSTESEACRRPGVKDAGKRKWKATLEGCVPLVGPASSLATALQRSMPDSTCSVPELRQRAQVGGHRVVAIVPDQHRADPAMLFRDGLVPSPLAFFRETRQLGAPLLP